MNLIKAHPETGEGDCPAKSPTPFGTVGHPYLCTRDAGHDGSHMANGLADVLAVWDAELAWLADCPEGLWVKRDGREWVRADA